MAWTDVAEEVSVVTRVRHAHENREDNLANWIGVALPKWSSLRIVPEQVRFLLWQQRAWKISLDLASGLDDETVIHLVTYANDWLVFPPPLRGDLGKRARIWLGPVGGFTTVPDELIKLLPLTHRLKLRLKSKVVGLLRKLVSACVDEVDLVLSQNEYVGLSIPSKRLIVEPNPALQPRAGVCGVPECPAVDIQPGSIVGSGRLAAGKAWQLAVKAVAALPDRQLVLVGDGPTRRELIEVAKSEGVDLQLRITGWIDRRHIPCVFEKASVVIHPSLHEGASWAVAEAINSKRPVVGFDIAGVGTLLRLAGTVPTPLQGDLIANLAASIVGARPPLYPDRFSADRIPLLYAEWLKRG